MGADHSSPDVQTILQIAYHQQLILSSVINNLLFSTVHDTMTNKSSIRKIEMSIWLTCRETDSVKMRSRRFSGRVTTVSLGNRRWTEIKVRN